MSLVEDALRSIFDSKTIAVSTEFPADKWPEIFAIIEFNDSEFPVLVDFYKLEVDEVNLQSLNIKVAKMLSEKIDCKTICDGSGYGDDDSPYWSIVWDKGVSYLADDCGTSFGDSEYKKPVNIVKRINIEA